MLFLSQHWLWLFDWLTKQGASRATVILVFITAWYAFLTYRMSTAMARQTRALVQPALHVQVRMSSEECYPEGSFVIQNVGTQTVLLLDISLSCSMNKKTAFDRYTLWDEHILPPGQELEPIFDFTRDFEGQGLRTWSSGFYGYYLGVTASDLSKSVVLTYSNLPILSVSNVRAGMPWRVRMRYAKRSLRWKWQTLKRNFKL
jgi:hypothetical protein